ncbi:DUF4156 domain-containing protein [Vibrio sp. SCSIO 43136]|uniref:DUF4156 domain-containing protein n=1 Tax=Vibrio sp. SCSIO 43136 TaxID=2819101 RepID=UPI0020750093|nr:DUF4156 domain-containing protein [Vibrio sp. SCSIO 43136]USD65954.1 DUF4156 domain-containing protein [Vibrio sp. SCSIO 43136]
MKRIVLALALGALAGCSTPTNQVTMQSRTVQVLTSPIALPEQCTFIDEVIGNEGHWYSYLFYTNDSLIQGAVNQVKNRAQQAGADTVVLHPPHEFATSVTLLGSAYRCEK